MKATKRAAEFLAAVKGSPIARTDAHEVYKVGPASAWDGFATRCWRCPSPIVKGESYVMAYTRLRGTRFGVRQEWRFHAHHFTAPKLGGNGPWVEWGTGGNCRAWRLVQRWDESYYLVTDEEDPALPTIGATARIGYYAADGSVLWEVLVPDYKDPTDTLARAHLFPRLAIPGA